MGLSGSGAAKGAMSGATAGAAFGPVGSAIGGVAGGLFGGLFGGEKENPWEKIDRNNFHLPGFQQALDQRQQMIAQAGNRAGATAGFSDFRNQQHDYINQLRQGAAGQLPSLANAQLRQGVQQATAQGQALAATGRGNSALAQRQAQQQAANLSAQANTQASLNRLAEQQQYQQMLGGALQSARGLDQNVALANLRAEMEQRGLNDLQQRALLEQALRAREAQQRGGIEYERARTSRFTGESSQPGLMDQLMGGAGGLGQAFALWQDKQDKKS